MLENSAVFYVNGLSWLLNFISILVPWVSFSANTPSQRVFNQLVPGTESTGSIYLYQTLGCAKYVDAVADNQAQATCSLITTGNLPQMLGYMKDSNNVAIAFTILSLFANSISLVTTYLFSKEGLETIFGEQPFYRARYTVLITNSIVFVFNSVAFGVFSALINTKFVLNTDGLLIGFNGTQNRTWNYGGGFGLSIVVTLLSGGLFVHRYIRKQGPETKNVIANPMLNTMATT
jgi:hypothetical protein